MYSIPYVVVFIALIAMSILNKYILKSQRKWVVLAAYILLFIFFGFRGYIGDDWQSYYTFFKRCSFSDLSFSYYLGITGQGLYEPAYSLLALICKAICNDYLFFQVICSTISLVLLHMFLKRNINNENLGIAIFLLFGGFVMMINLMRNSIAILLIANALIYIEKKEPYKYFAICFLAGLFHFSAFLCLPLYWILRLKLGKWGFLLVIILANCFYIFRVEWLNATISYFVGDSTLLVSNKAVTYLNTYEGSSVLSIGFIERLITSLMLFLLYDKLTISNKGIIIYMNIFLIYVMTLMFLWENTVLSERLSFLTVLSYWILWPTMLSTIRINGNRIIAYFIITLYGSLKIMGLAHESKFLYDNHLWESKSYKERCVMYQIK